MTHSKLVSLLLGLLSFAFLATSTSSDVLAGDDSEGTAAGAKGLHGPAECTEQVDFEPCGGAFEGRWKLVDSCLDFKVPRPIDKKSCPEVETEFTASSDGFVDLEENGVGAYAMDLRLHFVQTFPCSCDVPEGLSERFKLSESDEHCRLDYRLGDGNDGEFKYVIQDGALTVRERKSNGSFHPAETFEFCIDGDKGALRLKGEPLHIFIEKTGSSAPEKSARIERTESSPAQPKSAHMCSDAERFEACGGDLTGEWKLVEGCVTKDLPFPIPKDQCSKVENTVKVGLGGHYRFRKDQTGDLNMDLSWFSEQQISCGCVEEGDVHDLWTLSEDDGCRTTLKRDFEEQSAFQYETREGALFINKEVSRTGDSVEYRSKPAKWEYCVDGDTAKMRYEGLPIEFRMQRVE